MNQIWPDIQSLAPPIIVFLFGMIVLLIDTGKSAWRKTAMFAATQIGLIVAAFASYPMLYGVTLPPAANVPGVFGGGMIADRISGMFCVVLCVICAMAAGMSSKALTERRIHTGEYYALMLFATGGAMVMALSQDLVNLFLGLEVLSVALYILCGLLRRELRSEESAVKYFLLGAFGSGFFLYGIALIYGSVGLAAQEVGLESVTSFTNLNVVAEILTRSTLIGNALSHSTVFVAGIALLFIGLAFKASIVPFHWYAPDVYEGAPTGVTAFMSAAVKVGAFAGFLRVVLTLMSDNSNPGFHSMLWWLAALTMVVGNAMAMRQTNVKRMLAYSSVAHAGYILVGIIAAGRPETSAVSMAAIAYYLFAYAFMNLGAFAVMLWLGRDGGEYTDLRDYAGLAKRRPDAAAVLTVLLLSLAGFPPVAGFFGKLYLFLGAVQGGEWLLATIGLVVSAVGVFYYLSLVAAMYFREPVRDFTHVRGGGAQVVAYVAAIASIVFGLFGRLYCFSPDGPGTRVLRPNTTAVTQQSDFSPAPSVPAVPQSR